MAYQDEWERAVRDKLGTGHFTVSVLDKNGIGVKVGHCKCPDCGKEQRAWYELPNDITTYESCGYRHGGIPHSM